MKQTSLFRAALLLAACAALAGEAQAERFSMSKSVGSEVAADATTKVLIPTSSGSSAAASADAVVGGGSTAASRIEEGDPETGKKMQAADLKRTAEAENARKAAEARVEEERRQEAARVAAEAKVQTQIKAKDDAKRLALAEREKLENEKKVRAYEWASRCVIKPVMTDEQIVICKEVWSRPPP